MPQKYLRIEDKKSIKTRFELTKMVNATVTVD